MSKRKTKLTKTPTEQAIEATIKLLKGTSSQTISLFLEEHLKHLLALHYEQSKNNLSGRK